MSAAGFANYDSTKKFSLSPEQIAVFANDDGPASMMGAYDMLTGAIYNEEKVKEAFKTGEGVDYKDLSNLLSRYRKIFQTLMKKI